MSHLNEALRLDRSGESLAALRELEQDAACGCERLQARVLKASLLEKVGRHGQSRAIASTLLTTRGLPVQLRARCEYVLARIDREDGDIEQAIQRLQRAASLAERADDLQCFCWANMLLTLEIAQRVGFDAASLLLSRTRAATIKAGDPQLTASLHLFVAQMEAQRGLLATAERHATMALDLLTADPNVMIEAMIQNTRFGIAILKSEYHRARQIGEAAISSAERSGGAAFIRAAVGNMGNLLLATGEFDGAVSYFERAISALPSDGENTNANLESIANIRLSQRRLNECATILARIGDQIRRHDDWYLYANRHSALTKARLLIRQGQLSDALNQIDDVIRLARKSGDQLLHNAAALTLAELPEEYCRQGDLISGFRDVGSRLLTSPPDTYAEYEAALAVALARRADATSLLHYRRARRVFHLLGNKHGLHDLDNRWSRVSDLVGRSSDASRCAEDADQAVVAMFLPATDGRLVASALVDVLGTVSTVQTAVVKLHRCDGTIELIEEFSAAPNSPANAALISREWVLSAEAEQSISINVEAVDTIQSVASLNAIETLFAAACEMGQGRRDREKAAGLWPTDDLLSSECGAVVGGRLRDVLETTRRVARTSIPVLVVGESGTGKEIIARAVHEYSNRGSKPFVPINCAGVPRHLLESTLFGHRRGAFTGADRDSPGLIRSAAGGTLFLDEIGELGLDLQPKLLRFLESGEIAPLGEPSTVHVDVRIVCATNRNLADLVQEGRFREDLFYRINVVRLPLKPLRERRDEIPNLVTHFVTRAAKEFGKGDLPVAEETMERLLLYRWPGNIRQLQNEIRRMVALVEPCATLQPDMISEEILAALPLLRAPTRRDEIAVSLQDKLPSAVARIETEMIKAALRDHQGRVDAVAKALGISRKGLYLKRLRLGL